MPHYDFKPVSSLSSAGGSNLPATLSSPMKTGIAVPANAMAARASDGLVYPVVETGKPGATLLPMLQSADITNGLQSPATLFATGTQGRIASTVLPSGNVVLIWAELASPYNAKFCIFDPHGVPVSSAQTIGPSSATGGGGLPLVCVAALASGNFVACYNAAGRPVFAIYDQSGAQVKAPTNVDAASILTALSIAALAGGNFVVCYNRTSTNEVPTYAVFNSTGTAVLAATVLRAAPASNNTTVASAVCALAGGGFVCAYSINAASSNSNYFKRFDAAGALQGSEVAMQSGVSTNSGVVIRALSGGGFIVIETAGVRLNAYNATGALQGSPISLEPGFTQNNVAMSSHPALDGALAAWQSSTAGLIRAMAMNGSGGYNPVNVSSTASTSGQVLALINGASHCVVGWSDASNKLAIATYRAGMDLLGSNVYSTITADLSSAALAGTATYLVSPLNPAATTFALAMPTATNNAAFGIFNAFVAARVTVGMFTASAAAGSYVAVQYSGVGTLSTAFSSIVAVDYRSNNPTGIKFSIVGNSAVMWGVQ